MRHLYKIGVINKPQLENEYKNLIFESVNDSTRNSNME